MADVIDLGNKNWPQFRLGFQSLEGFGPKAVNKLKAKLPSTAPAQQKGADEGKIERVRLLTFSAANEHLEPGSEYDATVLENGNAIVQLPNENPIIFLPHEFETVTSTRA